MKTDSSIKTKIEIQMATSQTSKVKEGVLSLFARRDLPLSLIEDHGFQKLPLWASNTRLTSNTSQHKIANLPVIDVLFKDYEMKQSLASSTV
jgi:hypothetical protein